MTGNYATSLNKNRDMRRFRACLLMLYGIYH